MSQNNFKYDEEFLDMVYYSEPYELNTMSQEAYSKSFNMTPENLYNTLIANPEIG